MFYFVININVLFINERCIALSSFMGKGMICVSIIVAAYNVEKYIKKCIESLLLQTLKEIQIVIVNDGSTDKTEEIISKFDDNRIIYLKKENGGLSDARNFGLKHISGEYLTFVDGDDFCEPQMYELLYEKAKCDNLDFVECGYYKDFGEYTMTKLSDKSITRKLPYYPSGQWNKLIKATIVLNNSLLFMKNVWYEDYNFNIKLCPYLNKIGFVDLPLYHYVQREDSIMHTVSIKITDIYLVIEDIINFYKDKDFYSEYVDDLEYVISKSLLISNGLRCFEYDLLNDSNLVNENYNFLLEIFPQWRKNPYLRKNNVNNICMKLMSKYTANSILAILHGFKK